MEGLREEAIGALDLGRRCARLEAEGSIRISVRIWLAAHDASVCRRASHDASHVPRRRKHAVGFCPRPVMRVGYSFDLVVMPPQASPPEG